MFSDSSTCRKPTHTHREKDIEEVHWGSSLIQSLSTGESTVLSACTALRKTGKKKVLVGAGCLEHTKIIQRSTADALSTELSTVNSQLWPLGFNLLSPGAGFSRLNPKSISWISVRLLYNWSRLSAVSILILILLFCMSRLFSVDIYFIILSLFITFQGWINLSVKIDTYSDHLVQNNIS